jgi:hypothetical protein
MPAIRLLGGIWIARRPTCGYQLATAGTQERVERRAAHRTCPSPGLASQQLALATDDQLPRVDPPLRPGSRPARRAKT